MKGFSVFGIDYKKERVYFFALLAILSLGIFYRLIFANTSLYGDEAWRAILYSDAGWFKRILSKFISPPQPLGLAFIHRLLALISKSEIALRLVAIVPGIIIVFFAALFCKELFKNKFVMLFSYALIVLNPLLIDYTKDVKPFLFDFLACIMIMYFTLRYIKKPKIKYALYIFIVGFISVFIAAPVIFVFPASYLILLYISYKGKDNKSLIWIIGLGAVFLAAFLIHYKIVLYKPSNTKLTSIYYEGFYTKPLSFKNILLYFPWIILKLIRFAFFSASLDKFAMNRGFSPEAKYIIAPICAIIMAFGVVKLVKEKKYRQLLLFTLPIFFMWIASLLKKWPFEPDRMNIFIISSFSPLVAFGIKYFYSAAKDAYSLKGFKLEKVKGAKNALLKILPFVFILVFYSVQFGHNIKEYSMKDTTEEIKKVLNYLKANYPLLESQKQGKKTLLAHNWFIDESLTYYLKLHPYYSKDYAKWFNESFRKLNYTEEQDSAAQKKYIELLIKNKEIVFVFGKWQRYLRGPEGFIEKMGNKKVGVLEIVRMVKYHDAMVLVAKSNIYAENALTAEELKRLIQKNWQETWAKIKKAGL